MEIGFILNGKRVETDVAGRERLIDLLRRLGVKSVKEGCGTGDCGACNVIVDNRLVNSCLMLGVQVRGKKVLTTEGLPVDGKLHKIQEKLVEYTASQCGYCIPGVVMTAKYILDNFQDYSEESIRHVLIANICRCGGYTRIVDAVKSAIKDLRR